MVRFGFELIERIASFFNVKITVLNQNTDVSFESELAKDVLTIITVFSALKRPVLRITRTGKIRGKTQELPRCFS